MSTQLYHLSLVFFLFLTIGVFLSIQFIMLDIKKIKYYYLEMGLSLAKAFMPDPNAGRVLMLGLDFSGKTTILYQLKLGEAVSTIPTIGFNVETIDFKGKELTIWDVGGQDNVRSTWSHYFKDTNAIIYVIDSADKQRIEDCLYYLQPLLLLF